MGEAKRRAEEISAIKVNDAGAIKLRPDQFIAVAIIEGLGSALAHARRQIGVVNPKAAEALDPIDGQLRALREAIVKASEQRIVLAPPAP